MCVAELFEKKKVCLYAKDDGEGKGNVLTLPAMMASSGASRGAWGARRVWAADTSYAVEVWRKSAVCKRARLEGEVGVVDSK